MGELSMIFDPLSYLLGQNDSGLPNGRDIPSYLMGKANGGGSWQTFTGNPLEFDARKAHSLRSCVVNIEPVQSGSGDPSPDNVRPISGWTGANVYLADCIPVTLAWDASSNGKYIGANGAIGSSTSFHYTEYLPVTKGKYLYEFTTTNQDSRQTRIYGYDASKNWVRQVGHQATSSGSYSIEFVVEADISYVRISNTRLGVSNEFVEPKQLSALAVDWTDEAGTVYGGTLDVTTGVLTKTWAGVILQNRTWTMETTANGNVFSANAISDKALNYNQLCNKYKAVSKYRSQLLDGEMGTYNATNGRNRVSICDNSYSDATSFKNSLSDAQYIYELNTPATYQLTPEQVNALVGRNVMWTDCESLTVEAKGTAVEMNALQSLNLLMGGRYVNNGTPDDVSDDEALNIILGGDNR